jgi:tRNA-specific 2-thiouridylase
MRKVNQRVVVAMSGGVDSSMAAALLVEAGYDVVGVAMRLWEGEATEESGCCSLDDFLDARLVAERLRIPFYVMDFSADFRRSVVDDFVEEYRRGRTPNPCARCNQFVKFASFWDRARELGGDLLATGHYARVRMSAEGAHLLRGVDAEKDQSYYLFSVGREVLGRVRFPVGSLTKREVRREAERRGLPVARKRDSQEICFAPRGTYASFVEKRASRLAVRAGPIIDEDGKIVGRHPGVHHFTIGQRRGLGVASGGRARYVAAIDPDSGVVRLAGSESIASDGLRAEAANWLGPPPRRGQIVSLKIRSRFAPQPAVVAEVWDGGFAVRAAAALRAVTPGQAAVLYDGDRVIGGGWIREAIRDADGPAADVGSSEAESGGEA